MFNVKALVLARLKRGSMQRRLAGNAAWAAIEAIGSRGLQLLALMVAARLLGPEEFGKLSAVQGTLVFATAIIAEALRFTAASQIAGVFGRDAKECSRIVGVVARTMVIAAVVMSVTVLIAAPIIAIGLFKNAQLTGAVRLGALLIFLESISSLQLGILTGFHAFRSMAIMGVVFGTALLPAVIIGAMAAGLSGVLLGIALVGVIAVLTRSMVIVRTMRTHGIALWTKVGVSDLSLLWRVSVPSLMNTLIFAPVTWVGALLLIRSPNGFMEMGRLGVANQWFAALLFLPGVFSTASLPLLAQAFTTRSQQALSSAFRTSRVSSLLVAVPAALAVMLCSSVVMSFYGHDFAHGRSTLVIVSVAAVIASTVNLTTNLLAVVGRMWQVLWAQCCWAAAYLAAAAIGLHFSLGADAIALAMVAGLVAKLITSTLSARGFMRDLARDGLRGVQ